MVSLIVGTGSSLVSLDLHPQKPHGKYPVKTLDHLPDYGSTDWVLVPQGMYPLNKHNRLWEHRDTLDTGQILMELGGGVILCSIF